MDFEADATADMIRRKNVVIFFLCDGKLNISQISRHADATYSHVCQLTDKWAKHGLIEKGRKGRSTTFRYTNEGQVLVGILRRMVKV